MPLLSAVALAGVLIGAAVGAMNLGPAADARSTVADAAGAANPDVAAVSPSAQISRGTDDRASRSGLRALPSPVATTTSASPKPSPTRAKPTQTTGGTTTSSGTCGVSYYSDGVHTANGEDFDPNAYTAASKTLPFNTRVRVTNRANGKSVVVRINDRGPYVSGRCLDLTRAAFAAIASLGSGVLPSAKWEVLS